MKKQIRITATEYSNKRGQYLDDARAGKDVIIERNHRIAAVLVSGERYELLQKLEQELFADEVKKAPEAKATLRLKDIVGIIKRKREITIADMNEGIKSAVRKRYLHSRQSGGAKSPVKQGSKKGDR